MSTHGHTPRCHVARDGGGEARSKSSVSSTTPAVVVAVLAAVR